MLDFEERQSLNIPILMLKLERASGQRFLHDEFVHSKYLNSALSLASTISASF
jgi:hypothetical protein